MAFRAFRVSLEKSGEGANPNLLNIWSLGFIFSFSLFFNWGSQLKYRKVEKIAAEGGKLNHPPSKWN